MWRAGQLLHIHTHAHTPILAAGQETKGQPHDCQGHEEEHRVCTGSGSGWRRLQSQALDDEGVAGPNQKDSAAASVSSGD